MSPLWLIGSLAIGDDLATKVIVRLNISFPSPTTQKIWVLDRSTFQMLSTGGSLHLEKIFRRHASVFLNGEWYMSHDDFFRAIDFSFARHSTTDPEVSWLVCFFVFVFVFVFVFAFVFCSEWTA